jgi:hypothetical protein
LWQCTPGFLVGVLRQNWVTPKTVPSVANSQQIDLAQHRSKFCDARHAMQNRRLYNDNTRWRTRRRRRFVANRGGGAVGTRRVCFWLSPCGCRVGQTIAHGTVKRAAEEALVIPSTGETCPYAKPGVLITNLLVIRWITNPGPGLSGGPKVGLSRSPFGTNNNEPTVNRTEPFPRGTRPKDVDMILELIWPLNEAPESGDVTPPRSDFYPAPL